MFPPPITKLPLADNKTSHGVRRKGSDTLLWNTRVLNTLRERRGAASVVKGYREGYLEGIVTYILRKYVGRLAAPIQKALITSRWKSEACVLVKKDIASGIAVNVLTEVADER